MWMTTLKENVHTNER